MIGVPDGPYPDCLMVFDDGSSCRGSLLPKVEPVVVNVKEEEETVSKVIPGTHVFFWRCSKCARSV